MQGAFAGLLLLAFLCMSAALLRQKTDLCNMLYGFVCRQCVWHPAIHHSQAGLHLLHAGAPGNMSEACTAADKLCTTVQHLCEPAAVPTFI